VKHVVYNRLDICCFRSWLRRLFWW